MNRDLTVNLRLTAATGENAKVASDVINTVNRVREAMTAAAKAAEAIGTSTVQMGASARTAATGLDTLRTKVSETTKAANDASTAVNNLKGAVTSVNGAVLAGASAWTSATRQILSGVAAWTSAKDTVVSVSQSFEKIQGMRQYSTAIGPSPSWMNMYDSAIGPERRGIGNQYTSSIGPVPFNQLGGSDVMDFVRRQALEDNRRNWWRTPPRPGLQTNDGMFEGGANFVGPVRPTGQMGPFETPEFMSARYAERETERQRQIQEAIKAEEAHRQAIERTSVSQLKGLEAVRTLNSGVMALARSYVLLTASNSESAQAMLIQIAKFESLAQAVSGVISVVQGATRAWNLYRAALAAAAAGEAIGGFSSIAGSSALGKLGTGVAAASTFGVGMGIGQSIAYNFDMYQAPGEGGLSYRQADRYKQMTAQQADPTRAFISEIERKLQSEDIENRLKILRATSGMTGLEQDRAITEMRIGQRQSRVDMDFSTTRSGLDPGQEERLRSAQLQSIREQQADQNSLIEITRKQNDERMKAEQKLLDAAEKRLTIAAREEEMANRRYESTTQSLFGMNVGERRRVADLAPRALAGETFTNERDIQLLQRANIPGTESAIQKSIDGVLRKSSLGGIIDPLIEGANRAKENREKAEFNVNNQTEIIVKMGDDNKKREQEITIQVSKAVEALLIKEREVLNEIAAKVIGDVNARAQGIRAQNK